MAKKRLPLSAVKAPVVHRATGKPDQQTIDVGNFPTEIDVGNFPATQDVNVVSPDPLPVSLDEPIDTITGAIEIVDYAHHEVHSGSHYFIEGYTTLGNGDSLYVKMVTPDTTKWSHFLWEISSSFILTTSLTEDATGGMTGGGSVTPRNNNRNFADASGMVITSGVTVNTGGTIISSSSWGAKSDGGGHSRDDEIILKQNTIYLRAFTSSTNSNIVSFKASWYEHTNK